MSPSPPLARFDIRCLWQASMRAFYMNLHRIPKSTLRYSVSDSCLASRWMDGWMTDSLPKRIYINTLGVCVCVCVLCKWIIKHFFLHSNHMVLCSSRRTQTAKSPSTLPYCFPIEFHLQPALLSSTSTSS